MKKVLLGLVLAGMTALGGCTDPWPGLETDVGNFFNVVFGNSITPTTVYAAANTFDAAEATATQYLKLPVCPGVQAYNCRTIANTKSIVTAVRTGRQIRNQLEALISAGQGNAPVPTSLYNALIATVSSLQTQLAGNN